MKIIREGKEFELTAEELLAAYQEQEAIWDRSNIVQNMEWYLSSFEQMALSENESFIASATSKLRENEDNGLSYDDALRFAFKEAKKEFSAELASFVDPDTFDFSDRKDVETAIYNLLGNAEIDNSRELDVSSPYYQNAMELLEVYCSLEFRDLYEALDGSGRDLVFRDGEKFDYTLFYYNPDSASLGQFVQCPFSAEQVRLLRGNPNYMDVLAENTQYLSDVNTITFFDTVFHLIGAKEQGRFLGNSVHAACTRILTEDLGLLPQPDMFYSIKEASTGLYVTGKDENPLGWEEDKCLYRDKAEAERVMEHLNSRSDLYFVLRAEELAPARLVAYDIDWDVDEESEIDFLPEEIQLPAGMVNDEEISDYLSDVTGYCHRSFSLRESTRSSLADQIQSASNRAAISDCFKKSPEKGVPERG